MTTPWLTIVGMGEDGLTGLPTATQTLVDTAAVLVGGQRLLTKVTSNPAATRLAWTTTEATVAAIVARRGSPVVVVASGDPLWFGVAATLARAVDPAEMLIVPHVSSFALAAARLVWPLQDVACVSAHGRPASAVRGQFAPGRRMLVLVSGGQTVPDVAALLVADGYGDSRMVALSHLGGPAETQTEATAASWAAEVPDLTVVAIECRLAAGRRPRPLTPGLPDDAFEHDGQITKQEVRAVTVCALAPWSGAVLWDIGGGSGSVAIEWLRAAPGSRAVCVERDSARLARIARNAVALGVPHLVTMAGEAPAVLPAGTPDAIFVGGGVSVPGLLEACWHRLAPGGRLVANAVTLEAEAALLAFAKQSGGTLGRIAISRTKPTANLTLWSPLAPVTQLVAEKP